MAERHMKDIVHDRQVVHDRQPVMLSPGTSVQEACQRMRERRVGAVLVTDRGKLRGIFTGRDAVRLLAEGKADCKTPVGEVMTKNPVTIAAGEGAIEALRLMQDCGCRHLPVIDSGKVVGVVSKGDFRGMEQARLDEETGYFERLW
jgi:CBS domain-containing protein